MSKFSITDRVKSFKYAFNGIWLLIKNEHNAQIHLFAIIVTTALSFYLKISANEWITVIFCFGIVLMAEGFNSAIEALANKVSPEIHPQIKTTKDIAAGAVLISAIMALIIACIIFVPKIILLF